MNKVIDMFWLDAETKVRVFDKGVSISQANEDAFGTYESKTRLTIEQIETLYKRMKEVEEERNQAK